KATAAARLRQPGPAAARRPRAIAIGRAKSPRAWRVGLFGASAYFGLLVPVATGGRSSSPLTVFLPTYSPPLSRNMMTATAISAPRSAPNLPFEVLRSGIMTLSDAGHVHGQRRRRNEVPALPARPGTAATLWHGARGPRGE